MPSASKTPPAAIDAGIVLMRLAGQRTALEDQIHRQVLTVLDLGGSWTGEMPLTVRVALGSATIRIPRDAGVSMHLAHRFANVDANGLTERDGVLYSAGYAQAKRRVVIDGSATLANLDIIWMD